MISEFIAKKIREAHYKILPNGEYFGEIPGLRGVWASAKRLEDCRRELQEVLEDWIVLHLRDRKTIPGFALKIDRRALVRRA